MDIDFVFALHSTAKLMWKSDLDESLWCPPVSAEKHTSNIEEMAASWDPVYLVL